MRVAESGQGRKASMSPATRFLLQTASRHALAVVGLYSVVFAAFFSPIWLRGRFLAPGDGTFVQIPAFFTLPRLWNPDMMAGFPIAAEPNTQTYYPVARVLALFGAWNTYVISAYVLAASFMYGCVYHLTGSVLAGLVSGLSYGAGGFLVAHLGHLVIIHPAAWIPLILWSIERMRHDVSRRWTTCAAVSVGLCALAGHPQILLYGVVVSTAYAAVLGWSLGWRRRYYLTCALTLALGLGLGAAQLLPTVELGRLSVRAAMTVDDALMYSLPPLEAIRFFLPFVFGSFGVPPYRMPFFGTWGLTETSAYPGWLTLCAATIAVLCQARSVIVRFWLVVVVVSLLLAFGDAMAQGRAIYQVPGFNWFRAPGRHLLETSLALAILAGIGVAVLEKHGADLWRKAAAVVLVQAGAAVLLLALLADRIRAEAARHAVVGLTLAPWSNLAVGIPLLLAGLTLGVLQWQASRAPVCLRRAALCAALFADLMSFGWFYEWYVVSPPASVIAMPERLRPYRDEVTASHSRVLTTDLGAPPEAAVPNLSWLWGIPNAAGSTAVPLRRYSETLFLAGTRVVRPVFEVLDMLAIRYLFVARGRSVGYDWSQVASVDGTRWRVAEQTSEIMVLENRQALPRAWLVGQTMTLEPEWILQTLRGAHWPGGAKFDPRRVALVEEPVSLPGLPSIDGTAEVRRVDDHQVRLRVRSATPAFLVLSDVNYPGWIASVDGKSTRIHQTNYILRGIEVPAGEHDVRFTFRPLSAYLGWAISLLCAGALATLRWWWPFLLSERKAVSC